MSKVRVPTSIPAPPTPVRIWGYSGCFNFCKPEERQFLIQIDLPEGAPARTLSETWPESDYPSHEGRPPSEMVEEILSRAESYSFNSGLCETRKIVQWCRDNAELLNREWARGEVAQLEKKINEMRSRVFDLTTEHIIDGARS